MDNRTVSKVPLSLSTSAMSRSIYSVASSSSSDGTISSSRSPSSRSSVSSSSTASQDHICASNGPNEVSTQHCQASAVASCFQQQRGSAASVANIELTSPQSLHEEPSTILEISGQYSLSTYHSLHCDKPHGADHSSQLQLASSQTMANSEGQRFYCKDPNCHDKNGFTRNSDLKRHKRDKHTKGQQWYCGCCDKSGSTRRKDHLRQHFIKKHGTKKYYRCTLDCCNGIEAGFVSEECFTGHLKRCHNIPSDVNIRETSGNGL